MKKKTLSVLRINLSKLMNEEELLTVKGGDYGTAFCTCRRDNDEIFCTLWVDNCNECGSECFSRCHGAASSVCAGW